MNIVIAGDGEVGLHLAQELSSLENQNITIVDPHEDLIKMVGSHTDLLAITGDSTSVEVLKNANVRKADLLISVLHDEKINLLTAALGKQLGAKKTIARINNLEYLRPENQERFKNIGVDSLICPEDIVSKEIADLLKQTAATEIFDFSGGKLSLFLIKLKENAPVVNKTLNDIVSLYPHLDFRAVAIHRNSNTIIPKGDDKFQVNDLAYVITKPGGINDLLKLGGKPVGLALWQLFGTTNQLLAAIGLLVVSVYLFSQGKPIVYTVLPLIGMLVMVVWAMGKKLVSFYDGWKAQGDLGHASLFLVGLILLVLTIWLVVEAVAAFARWHSVRKNQRFVATRT